MKELNIDADSRQKNDSMLNIDIPALSNSPKLNLPPIPSAEKMQ